MEPRRFDLAGLITTSLEVVGLVAVSGFAGAGLFRWLSWFGFAVSGVMLLTGSWWMTTVGADGYVPVRKRTAIAWRTWRARRREARAGRRQVRDRRAAVTS